MRTLLPLLLAFLLLAAPARADQLLEGIAAYDRHEYQTAFALLKPLADHGSAPASRLVGLMYWMGRGVKQNRDEAVLRIKAAADWKDGQAQELRSWLPVDIKWKPFVQDLFDKQIDDPHGLEKYLKKTYEGKPEKKLIKDFTAGGFKFAKEHFPQDKRPCCWVFPPCDDYNALGILDGAVDGGAQFDVDWCTDKHGNVLGLASHVLFGPPWL